MIDILDPHQHTIRALPGKPQLARQTVGKWISSEVAFCLSVSDKSILNFIFPQCLPFPLGKDDDFYVRASWRAEGSGLSV